MNPPLFLKRLLVRTGVARMLPAAKRLCGGEVGGLHYLADRVLAAPVEDLLDPALHPAAPGPDVIDLSRTVPKLAPPAALGRAADDTPCPARGLPELRHAVAEVQRRGGRELDPETEVLVTHGATGAFAAVLDAFVNPGDRVVLFDPCSPAFAVGAKSRRARLRWVPTWNEDGRLRFPPAALKAAIRGARLIVLADPNNPTGASFHPAELDELAALAERSDTLIYRDESFARFGGTAWTGAAGRTLVAGSAGCGYGLGGLRVGWLCGPRHLLPACTVAASLSAPFVPPACQQAAARALLADERVPAAEVIAQRRRYGFDRLRAMGLEPDAAAGGFFAWVPVAPLGLTGRAFAERVLKEQKVMVRPGDLFGPSGDGHVRVSLGADDGRVREGLARLEAFVASLKGVPAETPDPAEESPAENADAPQPVFSRV